MIIKLAASPGTIERVMNLLASKGHLNEAMIRERVHSSSSTPLSLRLLVNAGAESARQAQGKVNFGRKRMWARLGGAQSTQSLADMHDAYSSAAKSKGVSISEFLESRFPRTSAKWTPGEDVKSKVKKMKPSRSGVIG